MLGWRWWWKIKQDHGIQVPGGGTGGAGGGSGGGDLEQVLQQVLELNTGGGGGGGGGGQQEPCTGGAGGSGIVVIKETTPKCASGRWTLNEHFDQVKNSEWINRTTPIDYMVVAGGGSGGSSNGAGGGAGGYRASGFGPSPLRGSALELSLGSYSVTVGAGGAGTAPTAQSGSDSSFNTITSTGGGGGGGGDPGGNSSGRSGGSGGGGAFRYTLEELVIHLLQTHLKVMMEEMVIMAHLTICWRWWRCGAHCWRK